MNHSQKWLISQASGVKISIQIYYVSNYLHLIMYSCSIITFYITLWCFYEMTLIQDQGKHCSWKRTWDTKKWKSCTRHFWKLFMLSLLFYLLDDGYIYLSTPILLQTEIHWEQISSVCDLSDWLIYFCLFPSNGLFNKSYSNYYGCCIEVVKWKRVSFLSWAIFSANSTLVRAFEYPSDRHQINI